MLVPRYSSNYCDFDGYCYSYNSPWNSWARWVVLTVVIVAFFVILFLISCLSARKRRRRGLQPYRGTGFLAGQPPPGHGPATYNPQQQPQPYYGDPNQQYNQYNQAAAPPYAPNPHGSYYGPPPTQGYPMGQQSGVELQQPQSAYQPQRGGDPVYSPPTSPPPAKEHGIVR